jgi:hypothetical protein
MPEAVVFVTGKGFGRIVDAVEFSACARDGVLVLQILKRIKTDAPVTVGGL